MYHYIYRSLALLPEWAFRSPEVPVMASITLPVCAVSLAISVNVLVEVIGFGENAAVTPLGRPDTDRFTLPLNPYCGNT